jgi:hypothetical protein
MSPSPQRRNDSEDDEINERVLSWLPSTGIDCEVLANDISLFHVVGQSSGPRDSWSGYHNWDNDYRASVHHQCDGTNFPSPAPAFLVPLVYTKRKTKMPFDPTTRAACQSCKTKFHRRFEQCNVKELNTPCASSGKLSLVSLRVIRSYLAQIEHAIRPDKGQTAEAYLGCRRLKSLLHTLAAYCGQEPTLE